MLPFGSVGGNLTVLQPLIFPSGTSDTPPPLTGTVTAVEEVPVPLQVFLWLLFAVSAIFSVSCGIWTVKHRNNPKVRASQPIFLVCLCCGTFILSFSGFFVTWNYPYFSDEALNAACIADPWFLSFGLTTIFSALFSKIWRVHRVYRSAQRFRRVKVRVRDVLWPFVILMTLNLIILTVWTTLFPLKWTSVPLSKDVYDRVTAVEAESV
jgi:gamma-aminobutyric acid type B receptor